MLHLSTCVRMCMHLDASCNCAVMCVPQEILTFWYHINSICCKKKILHFPTFLENLNVASLIDITLLDFRLIFFLEYIYAL